MSYYFRNFILVAFATCSLVHQASGQVEEPVVDQAVRVLKNIDTNKTKHWAVKTLENAATRDSSAYVMNCLGLAYMAGMGVEPDSVKAVMWLENAGRKGFVNAYHNLGMLYKYGKCGVRQNFVKAYNYFSVGADSGSVTCIYDKGFMLYKGLGCEQDYKKAAGCFLSVSEKQHSPSLYMLGLCYRNGYGVPQDTVMASFYLNRSASLGYRDASEELARPYGETYLDDIYSNGDMLSNIPGTLPEILHNVNDVNLINGSYQGYLAVYDWSGKHMLGEKPMSMTANKDGDKVNGLMVIGEDSVPFRAELAKDSMLVFKKGSIMLYDRYVPDGKVKYSLSSMAFDVWNDRMSGRLKLYSHRMKEPERPMYFELRRDGVNSIANGGSCNDILVIPNPFETDFEVTFDLQHDTDVQVRLFSIYGMMVWNRSFGCLSKGENKIRITPNVKPGKYVLNIKAGEQVFHTIIIKKGGM